MPCIWEIKNKNKLVFAIDFEFRELLTSICKEQIYAYKGLPIQWEDIYNSFLSEVHIFAKQYNSKSCTTFRVFIATKCKFFAKNMCKKYSLKNHLVMNTYVEFDDAKYGVNDNTAIEAQETIDISTFNRRELLYFKYRYLQDLSIEDTCKKIGISRYKAEKINISIMRKAKRKYKI